MRWKIFLVVVCVIVAVFLFVKFYPSQKMETKSLTLITKVIDGDTVELASGKKVRLIGIDAPEERKYFYKESKERLRELVEGKEVVLEKGTSNADQYGRLLRYIYIDDTFVNMLLVKEGYTASYLFSSNQKFSKEFSSAEKFARENKLGMWSKLKS